MQNIESHHAEVSSAENATITYPLSKSYLKEMLDVADGNLLIQLGKNFRQSLAKLFGKILEHQISQSGKDPALFAESREFLQSRSCIV
jgi:hypothetical protein